MRSTIAAVTSRGANTPPMSAVVITTSETAHCSTSISRWRSLSSSLSSFA
jgi:hypothetical protein